MDHTFQISDEIYSEIATYAARHGQSPNDLLVELITEAVEQLKRTDSYVAVRAKPYNPANDPLAPFIGAFNSGENDSEWIEQHDAYFAHDYGEQYGDKK
ncbi:MAG TPA: hypothetical protein VJ761_11440 [Ktedonobacteraceae bacterium]|nr:hypothetical protein [Ktedonobacteraceae bacterium]